MSESRRQAYLQAMGFDVWLARPEPAEAPRLTLSLASDTGSSVLLVCERSEQSESRLATDIKRALGSEVCWAWPRPEGEASGQKLEDLVSEQLFTEVIVFGSDLANEIAGKYLGRVLGSARIEATSSLDELSASGLARQAFWKQLIRGRAH